jgi:hypothetical protein
LLYSLKIQQLAAQPTWILQKTPLLSLGPQTTTLVPTWKHFIFLGPCKWNKQFSRTWDLEGKVWRTPKLFGTFNCESKCENIERIKRVGVRSLARKTSG